ncbi:DegV family protein [Simiduia sp. 21SJ11W-1]|uniref:DegV family protein n=1 Tax=Simiduia sp. 21SJ11W-1 TaxID=2909669 RepID=UPI00209CABE0|nr:DegV family protein [Simiduia sp. 21SJ11W-1]UTA49325.1 DegV family protein [Simiduia sp. 21SJ11W-1]
METQLTPRTRTESSPTDRIGIAVDSSCDLTPEFIRKHGIEVLPIYINHADGMFNDVRDPGAMTAFYKTHTKARYGEAQSEPLSVADVGEIFERAFLPKYDRVNVITINSRKSQVYNRVTEAAMINEPKFRDKTQRTTPFRIRMLDSYSMFSGHAVLVCEFAKLIHEQRESQAKAIARINKLRDNVYGYMVPYNLSYMRDRRHLRKGDHKISWLSYKLAETFGINPVIELHKGETHAFKKAKGYNNALKELFEHAKSSILSGLATDTIVMSYGGLLEEIHDNPDLLEFRDFAKQKGVKTMLSMMSATAAVNVGPKAFSLAFARADH